MRDRTPEAKCLKRGSPTDSRGRPVPPKGTSSRSGRGRGGTEKACSTAYDEKLEAIADSAENRAVHVFPRLPDLVIQAEASWSYGIRGHAWRMEQSPGRAPRLPHFPTGAITEAPPSRLVSRRVPNRIESDPERRRPSISGLDQHPFSGLRTVRRAVASRELANRQAEDRAAGGHWEEAAGDTTTLGPGFAMRRRPPNLLRNVGYFHSESGGDEGAIDVLGIGFWSVTLRWKGPTTPRTLLRSWGSPIGGRTSLRRPTASRRPIVAYGGFAEGLLGPNYLTLQCSPFY